MSVRTSKVVIGRFQGPHNCHHSLFKQALDSADRLIIVLGSHNKAKTIKDPFSTQQRKFMLGYSFSPEDFARVTFTQVRDYLYNNNRWVAEVQSVITDLVEEGEEVSILGTFKDRSSDYLNWFPQWEFHQAKVVGLLNATDIRTKLWSLDESWKNDVHPRVAEWLMENYVGTEEHLARIQEYTNWKREKEMWSTAPYPVIFSTADAVVKQSGHYLMVRRKSNPGKGLWALPGGFVRAGMETVRQAAIRELKEETRIHLDKELLDRSIRSEHRFDHPDRSLRGHTITHAFYIPLRDKREFPKVKGNDDAAHAKWIPIHELYQMEDQIFEDHLSIIDHFHNSQRDE